MKVLLVFPSTGYYTRALSNPQGLLSVATFVRQHGHEVRLIDRNLERDKIGKVLESFSPDVVGCSVMSARGIKDALKVSETAKKRGVRVVWGGQMPSMQPELVLSSDFVDLVSIGEGEETWVELLEAFRTGADLKTVRGIVYKDGGRIVRTEDRPFADLAKMPLLDWSLIRTEKYLQTYLGCKKLIYVYSSKGCPCRCAFCSNMTFHKSTHRKRPNDIVVAEIKYLIENYGVDGVYFTDELWVTKKSDMHDFCRRITDEGLNFKWGVQLRIGMFEESDFREMYAAGCRWILVGVESGCPEMLERVHKKIDYHKIVPEIKLLTEIGITVVSSFIIGYPGETEEQVRQTAQMIKSLPPGLSTVYHFTPLPGTELFNEVVASGAYQAPASLQEAASLIATESLGKNFSEVPDRDLRVIRCWSNWRAFSGRSSVRSSGPFGFARDTVKSGLHSISQKGVGYFFVNGFAAAKEFAYTFWYSHAYGSVLKKYGLTKD